MEGGCTGGQRLNVLTEPCSNKVLKHIEKNVRMFLGMRAINYLEYCVPGTQTRGVLNYQGGQCLL